MQICFKCADSDEHMKRESEACWRNRGLAVSTVPDSGAPGQVSLALKLLLVLLHVTLLLRRSKRLSCSSGSDWKILAPGHPAIEPQKEAGQPEEEKNQSSAQSLSSLLSQPARSVAEAEMQKWFPILLSRYSGIKQATFLSRSKQALIFAHIFCNSAHSKQVFHIFKWNDQEYTFLMARRQSLF